MTHSEEQIVQFGEQIPIRTESGPISFGLVMSGSIVNWSDKQAKDLLLGRIWSGIYLYPTSQLRDHELEQTPKQVCKNSFAPTMGIPADWNKDGEDDLIVSDRHGFLYLFERKGTYPDLSFEYVETIKDCRTGLLFNLPHDNPNHLTGDQGGYVDPLFFNYIYPMVYPNPSRSAIDLIVGDKAGNLWWLPDLSDGGEKPAYTGVTYTKPLEQSKADYGKAYLKKHGTEFVRPAAKIGDETGAPFLLGEGFEDGHYYHGAHTRPVRIQNPFTGSDDLLVLAGFVSPTIYYLQRINDSGGDRPVFRNLGEVGIEGLDRSSLGPHSKLIVDNTEGNNDLLLSAGNHILRLKNKQTGGLVPEYVCCGPIVGRNVVTAGYNYSAVLVDRNSGKRYLADSKWTHIEMREIVVDEEGVLLSPEKTALEDQNGIFRMQGETDPQASPDSGFHQIAKWNFDGSGRQHLIAGSDKGHLYILVDEGNAVSGGTFKYRSAGPLKNCDGNVIKIHNRACPAAVDLDNDGLEDLIVGGATYQLGFKTDPNPGAGIYYLLNKGASADGLPILEAVRTLPISGYDMKVVTNRMVEIQAADLDNDGRKEIIISSGAEGHVGRVFRMTNPVGLHYTGKTVPGMSLLKRLLDLDGDGRLELVFAGGEPGIAFYRKMLTDSK